MSTEQSTIEAAPGSTALIAGERYTILTSGGFGADAVHAKIISAKLEIDPRDGSRLTIVYVEKGKRKPVTRSFSRLSGEAAIYRGWIDVDTNPFLPERVEGGMVCKSCKYASFDPRYFTDALASTAEQPIYRKAAY